MNEVVPLKIGIGLFTIVFIFGCFTLCAQLMWPKNSLYKRPCNTHPIIVIDPGHGGNPGSVSKRGFKEKAITLDIALRLEKLVKKNKLADVFLTRRKDVPLSLVDRRAYANKKKCDVFISIHANASHNTATNQVEVYYSSDWSHLLAKTISQNLSSSFQIKHRIEDVDWTVLWDNWAPQGAVLVETMYLTNEDGERILGNQKGREQIAQSLFKSLESVVSQVKKQPASLNSAQDISMDKSAH